MDWKMLLAGLTSPRMTWQKHVSAVMASVLMFGILTVISGAGGMASLYAMAALVVAATGLYFHYRRRTVRLSVVTPPITPVIDDGEITADMKAAVAVRDGGVCQIKAPVCTVNKKVQYDHVIPRSWGGPTTVANLQFSCGACNRFKSNNWAGTYANQLTRAEVGKMLV